MNRLELKVPPPLVALCCGGLIEVGVRLSPATLRLPPAPGGALLMLGLAAAVGLLAVGHLFRAGTTVHPHCPEKSCRLVAHGIYRYSRNPMYLALLLLLVAWSLYRGWWLAPLVWALFVGWITRFQIRPEERVLARLFGDQYRAYCDRVRRWL